MGSPPPPAAASQPASGAATQASQRVEADGAPAPKKRKTAAKPYCPQLGTANYAFLIVLYRVSSPGLLRAAPSAWLRWAAEGWGLTMCLGA